MLERFPDSIPRRVRGGTIVWLLQGGRGKNAEWNGGKVRFSFGEKPDAVFNQEMHVAQRRHQLKEGQKHEQRRRGSHAIADQHQQDDPGADGETPEVHGHGSSG
jgi:hypothetical protein